MDVDFLNSRNKFYEYYFLILLFYHLLLQLHFRVLPSSTYQLRYQLVPLLPGNVALPRLRLNLLRAPAVTMDAVLQKMLPTHIFVLVCINLPISL